MDLASELTLQCVHGLLRLFQGALKVGWFKRLSGLRRWPSSRLHFTNCYLSSLRPTIQHFLRPGERKLVQCTVHQTSGSASDPPDFARLLVVLHKDITPVLSIVSSSVSSQAATAILQNVSPIPFSLHPEKSFGHALAPPGSLTIPHHLLPAAPDLPWTIRSSTTGLSSHLFFHPVTSSGTEASLPSIQLHYRGINLGIEPDTEASSGEEQQGLGLKVDRGSDLLAISIKWLEPMDKSTTPVVIQVQLDSLWSKAPPLTLHVVPPQMDAAGHSCLTCSGPHPWASCPAMAPCSCSPSPHSRLECSSDDHCWNCGQTHNWRRCGQAILSQAQQELTQFGFQFGASGVSMKDSEEPVWLLEEALEKLEGAIKVAADRVVLVGYEILRTVSILAEAGKHVGKKGLVDHLLNGVFGVVDVQWLMPASIKKRKERSLYGLCVWTELRGLCRALKSQEVEARDVTAAVKGIIQREIDTTRYKDFVWMVENFGLRLHPGDSARLQTIRQTAYKPKTQFFLKFKKVQKSKADNANFIFSHTISQSKGTPNPSKQPSRMQIQNTFQDDDGEGMLTSYTRPIKKPSTKPHYISKLYDLRDQARLMVLALKTVELGEKTYLCSLSLRAADGSDVLEFPAIVPRDFYSETPAEQSDECRACLPPGSSKASLHWGHRCPAAKPCTIHPPGESPAHLRRECLGPACWNCGLSHPWLSCPQPVLTETQHFFCTLGYGVELREVGGGTTRCYTYCGQQEGGLEFSLECVREEEVLEQWLKRLGGCLQPLVLFGYTVGEQLRAMLACAEGEVHAELENTVQGLVDLRWFPRWKSRGTCLVTMLEELGVEEVRVEETKNVTKLLAELVRRGGLSGDELDQARLASTLACSPWLLTRLGIKDVIITGPEKQLTLKRGQDCQQAKISKTDNCNEYLSSFNYFMVFVYLTVGGADEIEQFEIEIWEESAKKTIFSGSVDLSETDLPIRKERLLGSVNLLVMLSKDKDNYLTVVTVCPKSLELFQILWTMVTDRSFHDIFRGWTSLASEAYSLLEFQHPGSLLIGLPLEATRLSRLHRTFGVKMADGTIADAAIAMREVWADMRTKYKDKFRFEDERPGSKKNKSSCDGRVLCVLEEVIYLFMEVTKDSTAEITEEEDMPQLSRVYFTHSGDNREAVNCLPEEFLFKCMEVWPSLGQNKRLVLVSLDTESLALALSIGSRSEPGLLGRLVAGVASVTSVLAALKGQEESTSRVEQFWTEEVEPNKKITLGDMKPDDRVEVIKKVISKLIGESGFKDQVHPLLSPFTNSVLVNSGFGAFRETFVQISVSCPLADSKVLHEGKVRRPVWNYSWEYQKVMVRLWPRKEWGSQALALKRNLGVVVKLRNNKNPKKRKIPFGHLIFLAKDGSEDESLNKAVKDTELKVKHRERFGKDFIGFKVEYQEYKMKRKEVDDKQFCQQVISQLRRLGFSSLQDMFDHILSKCRNSLDTSLEDLALHLQLLLCGAVDSPAEVANILFAVIYAQLQLGNPDCTLPPLVQLRAAMFPKKWLLKTNIDGAVLETQFEFTQIKVTQEAAAENIQQVFTRSLKRWLTSAQGKQAKLEIEARYEDSINICTSEKERFKVRQKINRKIRNTYKKGGFPQGGSKPDQLLGQQQLTEATQAGGPPVYLGPRGNRIEVLSGRHPRDHSGALSTVTAKGTEGEGSARRADIIELSERQVHPYQMRDNARQRNGLSRTGPGGSSAIREVTRMTEEDEFIKRAEGTAKTKALQRCKENQLDNRRANNDDEIQIIEIDTEQKATINSNSEMTPKSKLTTIRSNGLSATQRTTATVSTIETNQPELCSLPTPVPCSNPFNLSDPVSCRNKSRSLPEPVDILSSTTNEGDQDELGLPDPVPVTFLPQPVPCREHNS